MKPTGQFFVGLCHWNGLRIQKNSKKYRQFAKTQVIEAIKIISCYLNNFYFYFCFTYINSAKIILKK